MQIETDALRLYLRGISANDFILADGRVDPRMLELMLKHIGDPDPDLRDELIYFAFYRWICRHGYFKEDELCSLIKTVMDGEHLFYRIGSREDDSVFTRTFSMLVVSLILNRHRQSPFLPPDSFAEAKNRLLEYCALERDFRGYTREHGWAHSAAHASDALDELALCVESDGEVHREILRCIRSMLHNGAYLFCHQEDDRLVTALHSVIQRGLITVQELEAWFDNLMPGKDDADEYGRYICRVNSRNLLRSLYFRGLHCGYGADMLDAIQKAERKLI